MQAAIGKMRAPVARMAFRRLATAAPAEAAASNQLTLNFTTPHTPVYTKKLIDKVMLPGTAGEYGVTAGHSPIISELKPGVVSVVHLTVSD
jgi:F-type H+-transporting ATPase subunit delta